MNLKILLLSLPPKPRVSNMLFNRKTISLHCRNFNLAIVLIALVSLSSCSAVQKVANVEHVASVESAQIEFNKASEKEIELLSVRANNNNASDEMAEVASSYNSVHKTISSLILERRDDLKKDNLLGQAYTIKALTEWKTGKSNEALSTIDEASNSGVSFLARDNALMKALPSLIKNDEAKELMDNKQGTFTALSNQLEESVLGFNNAISSDSEMDNSRLYLLTSQLGVMKNWSDLINDHRSYVTDSPAPTLLRQTQDEWCDNYLKDIWSNYSTEVNRVNTANACQVYNNFFDLIGPDGCSTIQTQKLNCADL